MRSTNSNRKRPCRICGKWFKPNPRLGERQRTCGDKECQRQWHAKKCREWNKKNIPYFQEIYLERCLASCEPPEGQVTAVPFDVAKSGSLPATSVQEVISVQQFVIIRYLLRQPTHRFQEVIGCQRAEITKNRRQLPGLANSRGDSRTGVKPVS
jgi:hypothetical protein